MKMGIALMVVAALAWGETATSMMQQKERMQNQVQNRFEKMSTDELLEQRGTLNSQEEREHLHHELMNRQATMTKEQKEKLMKRPDKTPQGMGSQQKGMGYGQEKMKEKMKEKGMMPGQGMKKGQ